MGTDAVVAFAKDALVTALLVASPMLGAALLVGVVLSILQAVTQVHEMTLTFVPKILAVVAALIIFMPWMLNKLVAFAAGTIAALGEVRP